ncbi:MAG: hypothetical protein LKI24_14170 [Acidipropionibacterium sp.]|jgi:hypothetical protein|nr:hypothetical protein [Acidipropionibacterium sp.]
MPEDPQITVTTTDTQAEEALTEETPDTPTEPTDPQVEEQDAEIEDAQEDHRDGKRALRQRAQDAEAQVTQLTEQLAQMTADRDARLREVIEFQLTPEFNPELFWRLHGDDITGLVREDGTPDTEAVGVECDRLKAKYGLPIPNNDYWVITNRVPLVDTTTGKICGWSILPKSGGAGDGYRTEDYFVGDGKTRYVMYGKDGYMITSDTFHHAKYFPSSGSIDGWADIMRSDD